MSCGGGGPELVTKITSLRTALKQRSGSAREIPLKQRSGSAQENRAQAAKR
jgi:hypothetical protein